MATSVRPTILFSAGEASGDAYAAELASRLPDADLFAIGGRRVAPYATLVADSRTWGAVGIFQSVLASPRILGGYFAARRFLASHQGVFVPIDFGFVNIKLARYAKAKGWKVLYFVPPGSWRKTKQGADLPAVSDAIVTPFPWSADILNGMGAKAHYFGHPLAEMVGEVSDPEDRDGVAVLPGSRDHEVKHNLPVIAEALRGHAGPVRFGVASSVDAGTLERAWEDLGGQEAVFLPTARDALKLSRAAIVCSGTATLEAALCLCPCVVVYRGGLLMELEFRIRRPKFKYASLPNIILDRPVLSELVQWSATPGGIAADLAMLEQGDRRIAVLRELRSLKSGLAENNTIGATVALIAALCHEVDA